MLLAAGGFALGLWVAKRGKAFGMGLAIFGLTLIVLRGVIALVPGVEEHFYELDLYPYFKLSWSTAAATMVLGYLGRKVPGRSLGILLWLLSGVVVLQEGYYSLQFVLAERWYDRLEGQVDARGYCPQTSEYTCGAAAAAMLLDSVGVETDEREMAKLCLVRAGIGVTDQTLRRGIRKKLKGTGYTAQVLKNLSYDELRLMPKPCLVTLRQTFLLDHTVIVESMDEERLLIADPDPETRWYISSRWRFEKAWRGDAMVLKPVGEDDGRERGEAAAIPAGWSQPVRGGRFFLWMTFAQGSEADTDAHGPTRTHTDYRLTADT